MTNSTLSWLKSATIKVGKPKYSIIELLIKELGGWEEARPTSVVHASDVTKPDFCPRRWALYDVLKMKPKDSYVSTALRATFDIGNAVAGTITDKWLVSKAVGNWQCTKCGDQRTFCKKPPAGCPKSGTCGWRYVEPNFVSPDSGISGSIDVLLDLGAPKLHLVELKILSVDEFEKIVAPAAEHRIRTGLYMKLVDDSGSPYRHQINTMEAKILYTSRGFGKKHETYDEILPFKEFDVQRADAGLDQIIKRAKQIKIFRESGSMPSGICSTALDKYAKPCTACQACFSGQYPAEQEALT